MTARDSVLRGIVIVPAYNECACIGNVLDELLLCRQDFDIVVVDDGSRDGTDDIVRNRGVRLLRHPVNLGYGAAVQTGLRFAQQKHYDYAVLTDADGQHDPADIARLVGILQDKNVDVVLGSRFVVRNSDYRTSFTRGLGMRLFSRLALALTGQRIYDTTSGFQVVGKRAIAFLAAHYPSDFPDADVIIYLLLSGYRIAEVPAHFRTRNGGASMFTLTRKLYYPLKATLAIMAVVLRILHQPKE